MSFYKNTKISPAYRQNVHPQYRPDIDGLRALAVLAVIGFHAFPEWIGGGFIGVDIFFVISGFLISKILFTSMEKSNFSMADFYIRRIRRIFPALILVLTACVVFGWFVLLADEYMQLGKHITGAAAFVSNFVLWNEAGYFDNVSISKPLLHLWSLGIEEQFYIFWPCLLWLASHYHISWRLVLSLCIVSSFALNIWNINDNTEAFYAPYTRIWELLMGAYLAYSRLYLMKTEHAAQSIQNNLKSLFGIGLIVTGFFVINKHSQFPGWVALLPVLGTFITIDAGQHAWINRVMLSNKILVALGLISYPLYLWHWPLLSFAHIIHSDVLPYQLRIIIIFASILLAWLTYQWLEKPMRYGLTPRRASILLITCMLLILAAGLTIWMQQGFDQRASTKNYNNNKAELVRSIKKDAACEKLVHDQQAQIDYCRFNNINASETVAIIGDSHAHTSYPGIEEVVTERHKNTLLLANSGYPPLLNTLYEKEKDKAALYNRNNEKIIRTISERKDIKKVFFISRGTFYITGLGYGQPEWEYAPPPLITPEHYKQALQRTIDVLSKQGKKVYFVLENPETGLYPIKCIPRPLRNKAGQCELKKPDVYARQAAFRALISGIKNITLVDVVPRFCPEDQCKIMENGVLLYADDDHLSIAGSRFQAEAMRDWLIE